MDPGALGKLTLHWCWLLSGTWAEALDIIHIIEANDKSVLLGLPWLDPEMDDVFTSPDRSQEGLRRSETEEYINRQTHRNPLIRVETVEGEGEVKAMEQKNMLLVTCLRWLLGQD